MSDLALWCQPLRPMRTLLFSALVLLTASASAQDTAPSALATITGVVTNAETGEPVMGAGVALPELGLGAVSQRDGSFAIEDVPSGTHAVRAAAYQYHFVTVDAEVDADGAALDFALEPGAAAGCASHDHGQGADHADDTVPRPDGREG